MLLVVVVGLRLKALRGSVLVRCESTYSRAWRSSVAWRQCEFTRNFTFHLQRNVPSQRRVPSPPRVHRWTEL